MIRVTKSGRYSLTETRHGVKLIHMNGKSYAWIVAPRIGSLLIFSSVPHVEKDTLSSGAYRLYDVTDEPQLSDQLHLEVQVGGDAWQGYLLPTGLPTRKDTRKLMIPTHEIITHNPQFRIRRDMHHHKQTLSL